MPRIPFNKISQLLPEQFPEYVKENYQTFIDFLQAYYEFLEQPGNAVDGTTNVLSYADIDKTLDQFVQHFQDEFMPTIPTATLADKRKLAKHIKQFYRARGSEKSYRLLFRILFDEPVEFYYPKIDLLRPSDGRWSIDYIVRSTTFHDTFDFIAHQITGFTSGARANVENVIQFPIGSGIISELYLSEIHGTFIAGEKIVVTTPTQGTVQETLYNIVTGIDIINPGLKYQPGDTVFITGSGIDATAEVEKVFGQDIGRVVSASNTFIQNPGPSQVVIPPKIQLKLDANATSSYYNGLVIEITDGPGIGEFRPVIAYDGVTKTATLDADWVTVPTSNSHYRINLGKIKSVKIKDFGISYVVPTNADFTQSGNGLATGTVVLGPLGTYSGRWLTADSFLSDIKKIQDSFFWQDFSYVIKAQNSINLYRDIVKKLLHPAGTLMFGEIDLVSKFLIGPDFRTLERHKFKFAPYEGFTQTYPSPNSTYWGNPLGFANTQSDIYDVTVNSLPDSDPFQKRNHVADVFIQISTLNNSVPPSSEIVEYDFVQRSNPQTLYDIKANNSVIYNGILGSKTSTDPNDPTWSSTGLDFPTDNLYVNASTVPRNPVTQTVLVVALTTTLSKKQSLVGCIDSDRDDIATGYNISVNTDGSLEFRTSKFNGSPNNLIVSTLPNAIAPNQWFCATLRYQGNTIFGNMNNFPPHINSFGTNIDGTGVQNNSSGWFIGNQGRVPPFKASAYFGSSLWKRTLWKFIPSTTVSQIVDDTYYGASLPNQKYWGGQVGQVTVPITIPQIGNSLNGSVAYVIIWNSFISDLELIQTYNFLKSALASRSIVLP